MCNLAEGIEERATKNATEKATKATSEKFIISMYQKGYTLDQIADVTDISTNDVKSVIKKKQIQERAFTFGLWSTDAYTSCPYSYRFTYMVMNSLLWRT